MCMHTYVYILFVKLIHVHSRGGPGSVAWAHAQTRSGPADSKEVVNTVGYLRLITCMCVYVWSPAVHAHVSSLFDGYNIHVYILSPHIELMAMLARVQQYTVASDMCRHVQRQITHVLTCAYLYSGVLLYMYM